MIDSVSSKKADDHEMVCQLLRAALEILDRLALSTAAALVSQALNDAECHTPKP
jgi:hypothetical protein